MVNHRIFLVDDHPVMREGYASLIAYEPDFEVCGQAGSAEEAVLQIPEARPDASVIDLSLPGGSGLELIKQLRAFDAGGSILVVSAHDESLYAERVLRAGARGYLMKQESAGKVVTALRTVLDGGIYASEDMLQRLLRRHSPVSTEVRAKEDLAPSVRSLTDRELEVFEHFGHGRSTREIAGLLNVSQKTIESHRVNIKQKLGLDSAYEMIRHAVLWVQAAAA